MPNADARRPDARYALRAGTPSHARKVILGTDWWTDCDDVAALYVFAFACGEGLFRPLGVVLNACMPYSAASLSAALMGSGLSSVPVGIDFDAVDFGGTPRYQLPLSAFPHSIESNSECEPAVGLYRRLLSQADEVDLIEIGYPQALAALLESPPDDLSPQSGMSLVRSRVRHVWMMAGNWQNGGRGRENNFARNERARRGASALLKAWPSPITFLGWETAADIIIGGETVERYPSSLLAAAFTAHGSARGRSAWDPLLVYLAAVGNTADAGFDTRRGTAAVDALTGENSFCCDRNGLHEVVVKRLNDKAYADMLESILLRQAARNEQNRHAKAKENESWTM